MIALYALLVPIGTMLLWIALDATVSATRIRLFGHDQHTASMYIKRWARGKGWHKILLLLGIWSVAIDAAVYLSFHFILQVF